MTMPLLDKLKEELDRAGRAAQDAFDEGKSRLEAFRTRQLADKAAQALGYAVFRAKQGGGEVDQDTYSRLAATLATHDAEASRYETEIDQKRTEARADRATGTRADSAPASDNTSTPSSASAPPPDSATPPSAQDISG